MEAATVAQWAFFNEVPIPQDVSNILIPGEQPYAAFATTRDSAIFTSQRLIVRDAQGITGRKVEIYSLPYKNIGGVWVFRTVCFERVVLSSPGCLWPGRMDDHEEVLEAYA